LEVATAGYQGNLNLAEEYLAGRGIDLDAAARYRLGVVLDPYSGHETGRGRLAIPYLTKAGVVTIRFRAMDGAKPKYLTLPGGGTRLYNTAALHEAGQTIWICEGEFDALVTTEYAGLPAVGICGANVWAPFWGRIFADFDEVVIASDGDEAGAAMADRLMGHIPHARRAPLPENHDCNSFYLERGADELRAALC